MKSSDDATAAPVAERQYGSFSDASMTPRSIGHMSAAQEVANAVSMIPPACICAFYLRNHPHATQSAWIIFASALLHLPFSMVFHLKMAELQDTVHPVDNAWRALDQTFIMVSGSFWALALSGCLWYGVACGCLMAVYIVWIWQDLFQVQQGQPPIPSRGGVPGRHCSLLVVAMLSLGAVFARGSKWQGVLALLFFIVAAAVFSGKPCGGYSHVLFHVLSYPCEWCIISAAGEVERVDARPQGHKYEWSLLALLCVIIVMRHGVVSYAVGTRSVEAKNAV